MLVGHERVTRELSSRLPSVFIITGPPSVGKRLVAASAAMAHKVARVDFMEVAKLTVAESDRIKNFMATSPMEELKFALINIDSATKPAINDLLKSLEEPPSYARFSIISSNRVPLTLLTRGHKYTVGLLKPDELLSILITKGVPENEAKKVCNLGRVDLAMLAYSDISAKTTALSVLQSVETNDYPLFTQAFKAVDDQAAHMIIAALEESASQNWKLFNPEYLGVFAKRKAALTILAAWSNVASARPTLAIKVALESVMKG
jgi:hypothetical protein